MSKTIILLLIAVLLGTPTALATYTLDTSAELNTVNTSWTNATPSILSYTPGNGSTLMVLGISIRTTTYRTAGTPTFNGKSFISLGRNVNASGEGNAELWYLILEPDDTGSAHNVSVPNEIPSSSLNFHVATFKSSAGNTSTLHVNASKNALADNPNQSLTSTLPTVQVVEMFTGLNSPPTVTSPGTGLFSNDPGFYGAAFQYYIKTNTGAQILGWTGASDDYSMLSAAFNETTDMNITSNGNNVTNNNSLSITVNQNTTVNFNVSTNLTINSHVDTLTGSGVSENGNSTVGTFYQANVTFTDYGTRYVEIKVFNTTGGYDSRNWTVTVNEYLPKTIDVTLSNIPVSFGNLLSGSLNHEAVLPLNVTIQSTTNVYVNITLNGSHFLSGANSFNVDNLTYSNSSSGIKTSLTTDFPLPPYEEWVNISKLVSTNRSIFMWLAIPTGQEPGAYSSNINVCVEEYI